MRSTQRAIARRLLPLLVLLVSLAGTAQGAPTRQADTTKDILARAMTPDKAITYDLTITTNTTWSGALQVGKVLVTNGATLTIAAGASIDFGGSSDSNGRLDVSDGVVACVGTASNPVSLFSTAPPFSANYTWIGLSARNAGSAYSIISLSNTNLINPLFGIWAEGGAGLISAQSTSFTGTAIAVTVSSQSVLGNLTDCSSDGGNFDLGKLSASNCTLSGGYGGFSVDGGTISDCVATDCGVGFEGQGNFYRNLASNCNLGFEVNNINSIAPLFVRGNSAENCGVGYRTYGGVRVDDNSCVGSTTTGMEIHVSPTVGLYLTNLRISGTTSGPGLKVITDGDYGTLVKVADSVFSNNQTNVQASESAGSPVTLNPLLLGLSSDSAVGNNSILSGPLTLIDVRNSCSEILFAESCYWGQSGLDVPTPTLKGDVDIRPYLIGDPGIDIDNPFGDKINTLPPVAASASAYPNPFNPSTTISFDLPDTQGHVRLSVFDIRGHLVANLLDRTIDGRHGEVQWNGTSDQGNVVATGMYFYSLQVNGRQEVTGKLILAK